jgi:hypothetical protein
VCVQLAANRRPEPDLLRTDRVELVLCIDEPGRLGPDFRISDPPPTQSLTLALGSDNEETVLVYGPWADKQRSLFQEHFFPFAFQNQQVFAPQSAREAVALKVKVICTGPLALRLPHLRSDPGAFTNCKQQAGANDGGCLGPGQADEASFYELLAAQMARVVEEQRKSDELQQKYEFTLNSPATSPQPPAEADVDAQGGAERDGWWYFAALDLNAVLARLPPDLPEDGLSRFVDRFNAIATYQRALVAAAPDLPSIPLAGADTWPAADRARWFWGAYAGREAELVRAAGLQAQSLRELGYAVSMLPSGLPLSALAMATGLPDSGADLAFVHARLAALGDEWTHGMEQVAADPRSRLAEWFPPAASAASVALPSSRDLDNDTLPWYAKSRNESLLNEDAAPGHHHARLPAIAAFPAYSSQHTASAAGPLALAARSGTACGWMDVGVKPGTVVTVTYPWFPLQASGSVLELSADLKRPTLTTSATSCLGVEAASAVLRASILYPLAWNGEQAWSLECIVQTPKLYLLRTDMEAIKDLGADWARNALELSSVAFFIPSRLNVHLELRNAEWSYLVNENNVVAKPDDRAHNTYILAAVPQVEVRVDAKYIEFQPSSNVVHCQVRFASDSDFHLPARASLILPEKHLLRQIPLPVAMHGQGGATSRPDPVFMEFKEMKLDLTYAGSNVIHYRFICYPEAIKALQCFTENYLSEHVCPVSWDAFRASGGKDFKTLLAFRSWYEDPDSLLPCRFPGNASDAVARLSVYNGVMLFPTALYPALSPNGVLVSPEDDCVSVFTREFTLLARSSAESLENNLDIGELRVRGWAGGLRQPTCAPRSPDPRAGANGEQAPARAEAITRHGLGLDAVLAAVVHHDDDAGPERGPHGPQPVGTGRDQRTARGPALPVRAERARRAGPIRDVPADGQGAARLDLGGL